MNELIVLNEEAFELTTTQVDAVFLCPEIARYLEGELEFSGDKLSAIVNCCCVSHQDAGLTITDLDGLLWKYAWVPEALSWRKVV